MKTYLVHYTPRSATQDTWAVAFSLPYIATEYLRTGDGLWYIRTWLTGDQIKRRLAILFDDQNELTVHEIGREDATLRARAEWMPGRLEDEEPIELASAPRVMWEALQSAVQTFTGQAFTGSARMPPAAITAASSRSSRAA